MPSDSALLDNIYPILENALDGNKNNIIRLLR